MFIFDRIFSNFQSNQFLKFDYFNLMSFVYFNFESQNLNQITIQLNKSWKFSHVKKQFQFVYNSIEFNLILYSPSTPYETRKEIDPTLFVRDFAKTGH
jgi:hypothetical protein